MSTYGSKCLHSSINIFSWFHFNILGVIAARDNNRGIVGVAPGVDLYIVRILDNAQDGGSPSVQARIDAMNRCKNSRADIISMSVGSVQQTADEEDTLKDLYYEDGILIIAAAGDGGNTAYQFPASYDSVISCGGIDSSKKLYVDSQRNDQVDLVAPAVKVLSTSVGNLGRVTANDDDNTFDGSYIEGSSSGTVTGPLVDCPSGLCSGVVPGRVCLIQYVPNSDIYATVLNCVNGGGLAAVIYNNIPGDFPNGVVNQRTDRVTLGAANSGK